MSHFALAYQKNHIVAQQEKDGMSYGNQILTWVRPSLGLVEAHSTKVFND